MPRGQATGGPELALNLTSADMGRRHRDVAHLRVQQREKNRVYGRDGRGDENEIGCCKPLIQNENVIKIRYERQQESKVPWHMHFTPSWKLALLQTGKIIIGDDWHRELGSLLEMPRYPAAAESEFRRLGPESDGAGPCPTLRLPGVAPCTL